MSAVFLSSCGYDTIYFKLVDGDALSATEYLLGYDALCLEKYFRTKRTYPFPGHVGYIPTALPESEWAPLPLAALNGWGKPILYVASPDGRSYLLISTGRDDFVDARELARYQQEGIANHQKWGGDMVFSSGKLVVKFEGSIPTSLYSIKDSSNSEINYLIEAYARQIKAHGWAAN